MVLRARDDPLAIMRDHNREHIILVACEIQHTLAKLLAGFACVVNRRVELEVLELSEPDTRPLPSGINATE